MAGSVEHHVHRRERRPVAGAEGAEGIEILVGHLVGELPRLLVVLLLDVVQVVDGLVPHGVVHALPELEGGLPSLTGVDRLRVLDLLLVLVPQVGHVDAGLPGDADQRAKTGDVVGGGHHPLVEIGQRRTGALHHERVAGLGRLPTLVVERVAGIQDLLLDAGQEVVRVLPLVGQGSDVLGVLVHDLPVDGVDRGCVLLAVGHGELDGVVVTRRIARQAFGTAVWPVGACAPVLRH
jgi:hypothetical protein